jgi:hypothetical protein
LIQDKIFKEIVPHSSAVVREDRTESNIKIWNASCGYTEDSKKKVKKIVRDGDDDDDYIRCWNVSFHRTKPFVSFGGKVVR